MAELLDFIVGALAIYGAYAAIRDFNQAREKDAERFKEQLATFRAKNPGIVVNYADFRACRHYVLSRSSEGQVTLDFERTYRRAKKRWLSRRREGQKVYLSWLPPSLELEDICGQ